MKKNLEIERLRAIAVIMVFIAHCNFIKEYLPDFFKDPITGVDLFFVISGYVVTASLLRALPDLTVYRTAAEKLDASGSVLKKFFIRRVFRILPAAYFWLAFYFMLSVVFSHYAAYLVGTPKQIFKEIVYFSSGFYNYLGYKGDMAVHYIGHYWSLTVEEHFYLLLPFLLIFVASRMNRIFACILVIFLVAAIFRPFILVNLMEPHSFNFFTSHRRFDTLAFGVLLAVVQSKPQANSGETTEEHPLFIRLFLSNILPLFFLVMLWCGVSVLPPPFNTNFGLTVYALFGLGLVFLASLEKGYIFNYRYIREILEFIGERSYTIYLSHIAMVCLDILFTNWLKVNFLSSHDWLMLTTSGAFFHVIALFGLTVLISDIGYRVVEKPLIRFARERYQ